MPGIHEPEFRLRYAHNKIKKFSASPDDLLVFEYQNVINSSF